MLAAGATQAVLDGATVDVPGLDGVIGEAC
jgi:hypothetical protein